MRPITTTLIFSVVSFILGCDTASPEPEENVGQVDQAVCAICSCPLGDECKATGDCGGIVQFSPSLPNPCIEDCQCPSGTRCTRDGGSYGFCRTPTCSASYSVTTVPLNGTTTFSISSQYMPPGAYTKLFGTKDGIQDVNGTVFNLTSGSFTITDSPGLGGKYIRYVMMYGPNNATLCSTQNQPASVTFQ